MAKTSLASATGGSTPGSGVKKPSTTITTAAPSIISSDKTRRNSPTSVASSPNTTTAATKTPTSSTNTTTAKPAEATTATTMKTSSSVATQQQGQDKKIWKKAPLASASSPTTTTTTPTATTTTTNTITPTPTAKSSNRQDHDDDEGDDDSDDSSTGTGIHARDYEDNDDEDDSDDDVVGGIMAVGVLKKPPASSITNQKSAAAAATTPIVRKLPISKQEATQEAISKTVAENLAEQEYKAKASGRRPSNSSSTTTTTTTKPAKRRSSSIRESKTLATNNAMASKTTSSKKSSATATTTPRATAGIQRNASGDTASSHDEMMTIKNRERQASSMGGGDTMQARRLQRASSRATSMGGATAATAANSAVGRGAGAGGAGVGRASSVKLNRKMAAAAGLSSRTGWSSSDDDNDAKIKAKTSRSKSLLATRRASSSSNGSAATTLLVRSKSGDSTSSGDGSKGGTGSMMVARKRAPSTRRSFLARQDSLDDDDDDNDDNGPSLAPAISGASAVAGMDNDHYDDYDDDDDDDGPSLAVLPGAFAIQANGQHPDANNGKTGGDDLEDTGPSLAPQVSTLSYGHIENQAESASDVDDEGEDVETGVVVAPGAFVMYGPDHDPNSDSDDSSVGVVGDNSLDNDLEAGADLSARGLNNGEDSDLFMDEPILLPVQAMVYDPTVFDATVLAHDGEPVADPKAILRLRLAQLAVVLFSMAGIVLVVLAVVRGFGNQNANTIPPQDIIPTVQGWSLLGGPIFGPAEENQVFFGSAVSMSGDGKLLAVAAPGTDQGSGTRLVGALHLFAETESDNGAGWTLLQSKPGPGPSDIPSSSLAMSRTGNHVVVGYPRFQGGQVQLFHQVGAADDGDSEATTPQWKTAGVLVANSDNETDKDASLDPWFGYSVEITPNGQFLAVGSPLTEPDDTGSQRGAVYFYHSNKNLTATGNSNSSSSSNETMASSWTRLGHRIVGEPEEQHVGWSLALCSPPSTQQQQEVQLVRVAIGGPASNNGAGIVRVHELVVSNSSINSSGDSSSSWRQIGQTLVGSAPWLRFGESLALSDDGTILAVGARGTSDPGQVQVFRLHNSDGSNDSGNDKWIPDDQTLHGDQPEDGFGAAVSLSQDGNILAIGGPGSDEFTGSRTSSNAAAAVGHIKVYQYNSETKQWVQEGSSLGGSKAAAFGAAVAMSANGQRVAGGAPEADFDGTEADAGSVLVFNVGAQDDNDEDGGDELEQVES